MQELQRIIKAQEQKIDQQAEQIDRYKKYLGDLIKNSTNRLTLISKYYSKDEWAPEIKRADQLLKVEMK